MKRPSSSISDNIGISDLSKRFKHVQSNMNQMESVLLDENLIYEVMKHVDDPRTLASSACVSKQWCKTSQDERLWELICTKHSAGRHQEQQLRLVVTALGGFRKLFSHYIWPLLKHSAAPPEKGWPCLIDTDAPARKRWGKDEVNLSLSLLSISYYGKMNFRKMKLK